MNRISKIMLLSCVVALGACSDDKTDDESIVIEVNGVKLTVENLDNWVRYASQVAALLEKDAADLLKAWEQTYDGGNAYSETFKGHRAPYTSAASCVEQIIDGCVDIANEVGTAKIGDPLELLMSGKRQEALFAVESWFSWHSREDYANNIISIRNSYYGSLDGSIADASISKLVASADPTLDTTVKQQIALAQAAIMAIPDPFRNNINSTETRSAMAACANLENTLDKNLKPFFIGLNGHEEQMQAIVDNYVDAVVLPTYRDLVHKTVVLNQAVKALAANPSDNTFAAAGMAWLDARVPWETSEAFLFGPVDALGLDPNMDSWPLDLTAISNHIANGDFASLEWSENDSDEQIESAQNVRGFHTLEFLLFLDGKVRTANDLK